MTLDIENIIACGRAWVDLQSDAEKIGLRIRLDDVNYEPDMVRKAFDALTSDTPLLDHYPNGDPAYPPYTPKQVLLLANVEFQAITHADKEYQEAVHKIREELGREPPRSCSGTTARGHACRAYALAYAPSPYCYNHSTDTERDLNKELLRKEEELIKRELRSIDIKRTSKESPS